MVNKPLIRPYFLGGVALGAAKALTDPPSQSRVQELTEEVEQAFLQAPISGLVASVQDPLKHFEFEDLLCAHKSGMALCDIHRDGRLLSSGTKGIQGSCAPLHCMSWKLNMAKSLLGAAVLALFCSPCACFFFLAGSSWLCFLPPKKIWKDEP